MSSPLSLCYCFPFAGICKGEKQEELTTGLFSGKTVCIVEFQFLIIALHFINLATDNFSSKNKIGQGGFGQVYKVSKCFKTFKEATTNHFKTYLF